MAAKAKKNIQIKSSSKKGDKKVKILLSDELTIYTIEDIKDDIIGAVQKYDDIEIQGDNIKEMDLAFVQLINSVKETAKKDGKTLSIDFVLSEENKNLFDSTDITKITKNK